MSIYSKVESGTRAFKSRFHRSISFSKRYDCNFTELIPVLAKFVLPGDVWRIGGQALIRFLPMASPTLTPNRFKVRYFFVPLRLVEPNTELITTGSEDGKLFNGTMPEFNNFVADANKVKYPNCYKVSKYTLWDYLGIQTGDYENIKTDSCLPAQYWPKGYYRIIWDYFYDENLSYYKQAYSDFDTYWDFLKEIGADLNPESVCLRKDYFISSLPWQLKSPNGIAPAIDVIGSASFTPNYTGNLFSVPDTGEPADFENVTASLNQLVDPATKKIGTQNTAINSALNDKLKEFLNVSQTTNISGLGFTVDDLRTITAQTRIFERLARTGSRYTEYLRANFGVAPADGTLQRSQYLGGWSMPIVTTEVLQTAQDGSTPVGTMRGHGISHGGQRIPTFFAKEFGMIFGLAHVIPDTEYTTGCPKEFSYKTRWDFFNPSFQHLSEQEVKKGELFISNSDGENDDTFGFQAYANELRTSINITVGDFRDTLAYWTQCLKFTSRPNLNSAFITGSYHKANYNRPFFQNGSNARNILVDFYNDLDVYRPMVRYSTPGLVDHL